MRPPSVSAREIDVLAREVLGTHFVTCERVPVGFGNENWRVTDAAGAAFVLKVGPLAAAAKWSSTLRAYELAASAGVPIPRLVYSGEHGGRVVRVLEWIEGSSPAAIAHDPGSVVTFFADLGAAVGALHTVALTEFSSRLDGSAPSFGRWADYVSYRLDQVRARCVDNNALDSGTVDRVCTEVARLAAEVDDAARPTVCHRDLHQDNLLVDDHGRLVAIVDWDSAEAWDPAGEWFKLDSMLFPMFPGSEATFDAAYEAVRPYGGGWERRRRLADLIETLNAVANAVIEPWNAEYEARARARLQLLLAGT